MPRRRSAPPTRRREGRAVRPAARRRRPRAPRPIVPGSLPEGASPGGPAGPGDPHGHLICHQCGRISELLLTELDRHGLEALTDRVPGGWSVEGITFSLTGVCPRCQHRAA